MGWNGTTGFLSAPLSVKDISDAIVFPSNDVGQLCTEGNTATPQGYIKMWAKYKPFRSSVVGYATVAANQAAAAQNNFGLVTGYSEHNLVYNMATAGSYYLAEMYNEARHYPKYSKWTYLKPRGKETYNEWFRMLDFAGYNSNATRPPIDVVFTPNPNDRTKATFTFKYPTGGSANDMHIKDFGWYTPAVSGSENNWKYAIAYSPSYTLNPSVQGNPQWFAGPDIYVAGSTSYNTDVGDTDWSLTSDGFAKEVTIQRGRRRFFVPFITRHSGSNGSMYIDSVYLHTDTETGYSLPQTVTTDFLTNMWFDSGSVYSYSGSWEDIEKYGGTIIVDAELTGTAIAYKKSDDEGVDVVFYLASSINKESSPVYAFFYAPSLDGSVTNHYNHNNGDSTNPGVGTKTFQHYALTFTVPDSFIGSVGTTELYIQVYDNNTPSKVLIDEFYIGNAVI